MTDDLPHSAVLLLAALTQGEEFMTFEDTGRMAVKLAGHLVEVSPSDLADLEHRALIQLGDDDDSGMPQRITVTNYGKTFLKRHMIANRIPPRLALKPKVAT